MKLSPLSYLAIFLIKVYKVCLSPILGNNCRFNPSCSSYAIEAYRLHGFFKGTWLTTKRILRCHPWGGCGYDPVPLPKMKKKKKEESKKDV